MIDKAKANRLATMLTYRRVPRQAGEERFIADFIACVPGMLIDEYGNLHITIGKSDTLFSCHTDTVHRDLKDEPHRPMQGVQTDSGMTRLFKEAGSGCLGADDGVGIYVMLEMIAAKVPGLYIFHRDEEIGGLGSQFISKNAKWKERLTGIKRAIAFDRRGTQSVITHQAFERGCSDEFADALCKALDMGHQKDDGGTFTDTANYFELIPECTNVSCGYEHEHSDKEYVDVAYVLRLTEACIAADWEALPTVQSITERESGWGGWNTYIGGSFTRRQKKLSMDTVWGIKEMRPDDLKAFLEYCGVEEDDLLDFTYKTTMDSRDLAW